MSTLIKPRVRNGTQMKDLRKFVADNAELADDVSIVVPGADHSYVSATFEVTTALRADLGRVATFAEDHGEDLTPEREYGTRVPVVLVR